MSGEFDVEDQGGGFDGGGNNGEFTETEYSSWGSRMKDSCAGVAIGALLFFGSFGLLIWNEGRAVNREKDLQEGINAVTSLSSNVQTIDTEKFGQLVYLTADVYSNETLYDSLLNVSATDAIKLHRDSEMYQWRETSSTKTKKTSNGGTQKTTTYSYDRVWSSVLIRSNGFHQSGHVNPDTLFIEPQFYEGSTVMVGAYTIGDEILNQINWFTPWTEGVRVDAIPDATLRAKAQPYGSGGLYFGASTSNSSSSSPVIGDTRVTFRAVVGGTVSIVAKLQENGQLATFITSRGGSLLLFQRGVFSADELFAQAQADNVTLTWILRAVGFVCMFVGVLLVLQPIATFVDVIPCVGGLLEGGLQNCVFPLVAFVITIPLSILTISLAWIAYRPIFAGVLIGIVGLMTGFCVYRVMQKKKQNEHEAQENVNDLKLDQENDVIIQAHPEEPDLKIDPYPATPAPSAPTEADVFVPQVYKP